VPPSAVDSIGLELIIKIKETECHKERKNYEKCWSSKRKWLMDDQHHSRFDGSE
jgi:hypothetical protein